MAVFVRQRLFLSNFLSRAHYRKLSLLVLVLLFIFVQLLFGTVSVYNSSQEKKAEENCETATRATVAVSKNTDNSGKAKIVGQEKKKSNGKGSSDEHPPAMFDYGVVKGNFILTQFGIVPISGDDVKSAKGDKSIEPDWSKSNFVLDFFEDDGNRSKSHPILTVQNAMNKKPPVAEDTAQRPWKPICPVIPQRLRGAIAKRFNDSDPPTLAHTAQANPEVSRGGRYSPKECQSRSKIAVIIPLRGREMQLRGLLAHMHPIWQRQQLDYTVYTITQESNGQLFNKAKLMNAGFLEASKDRDYDCFIFHDVDMTAEDDRCLYHCPGSDNPREISYYLDKFDYQKKSYPIHCPPRSFGYGKSVQYFGGVTLVTNKTFHDVNGYSNVYWGWGGEDDDMFLRLWNKGYSISNSYDQMCSFHMVKHETETSNSQNEGRYSMLSHSISRMKYEGLNTLKYRVLSREENPLYTNITLDIGHPMKKLMAFMAATHDTWIQRCSPKMPWQ